jgi:hypothetical protein
MVSPLDGHHYRSAARLRNGNPVARHRPLSFHALGARLYYLTISSSRQPLHAIFSRALAVWVLTVAGDARIVSLKARDSASNAQKQKGVISVEKAKPKAAVKKAARCAAKTNLGKACVNYAVGRSKYCKMHQKKK